MRTSLGALALLIFVVVETVTQSSADTVLTKGRTVLQVAPGVARGLTLKQHAAHGWAEMD